MQVVRSFHDAERLASVVRAAASLQEAINDSMCGCHNQLLLYSY